MSKLCLYSIVLLFFSFLSCKHNQEKIPNQTQWEKDSIIKARYYQLGVLGKVLPEELNIMQSFLYKYPNLRPGKDIEFWGNKYLKGLNMDTKRHDSIHYDLSFLKKLESLEELSINNFKLQNIPEFSPKSQLQRISIGGQYYHEDDMLGKIIIPKELRTSKFIFINDVEMDTLVFSNNINWEVEDLFLMSNKYLKHIESDTLSELKRLDLFRTHIDKINLDLFPNLQEFSTSKVFTQQNDTTYLKNKYPYIKFYFSTI